MGKFQAQVKNYYENAAENGQSRLDVWEKGGAIKQSMTPSTSHKSYRRTVMRLVSELSSYLPSNKKNVLSCGCGNAFLEKDMADAGYNILATDLCNSALEYARQKGLNTQILDVSKPFKLKEKFHVIFSDGLIGHLVGKSLLLENFLCQSYTTLESGGIIMIGNEEPRNKKDLEYIGRADYYFTSGKFLSNRLTNAGFEATGYIKIPYLRPIEGKQYRVWSWGFKPRIIECSPNRSNAIKYKKISGLKTCPFRGKSSLAYMIMQPGSKTDLHKHPLTEHRIAVIKGTLEVIVNGKKKKFESGKKCPPIITKSFFNRLPSITILPGASHQVINQGETEAEWLCYENPPHN
ncbi:MAG: methyltransferase domain-containing protein [Patescibacteria group bacterium]|jgi:2-polyprenyl-3-methyl-5-hydroxy-6-metoxy-1,4-benzoquinol methylase